MRRLNAVKWNRNFGVKTFLAFSALLALCCSPSAATAQVPSVIFSQSKGLCGVGTAGCGDFSGTAQHLAANSRGDLFIPASNSNSQFIEEVPANGGNPVVLFTGLNPTYGGRAVYADTAGNLYYTYSDNVNYSVDIIYIPFINGSYPAATSYTNINNSAGQCSAFPVPSTQTTTCRVPLNYPSQYNYYVQAADVALDGSGNLYLLAKYESTCGSGPCYNAIIKFATSGSTSVIAQLSNNSGQPEFAVSNAGAVYYTDGSGNNFYYAPGSTTQVSLPFYYVSGVSIDAGGNVYFTQSNGATGSSIIELPFLNGTACSGSTCGNNQYNLSYNLSNGYTSNPNLGIAVSGYGNVFFAGSYPNSVSTLTLGNLAFGATPTGTTSGSSTLLLTFGNNNAYATFGKFVVTGPFVAGTTTCANGTNYGPYATSSCTVALTYAASAPGPQSGSIQALDNNGNLIGEAALSGIGTGATLNVDPGTVSTVGSGFTTPSAVAVDAADNTYIADSGTGSIYKTVSGSAVSTPIATGFNKPNAIAVDGAGNLYIGDAGNNRIVEIANTNGTYSTTKQVLLSGISGANGIGLTTDSLGNLYVADSGNARVLLLASSGNQADGSIVTTLGSNFSSPVAVAVDSNQDLYIADNGSKKVIQYAVPTSTQTTIVSGLTTAAGIAVDANGSLFVVDSGAKTIVHIPNIGGVLNKNNAVTLGTILTSPSAIAVDSFGNVYVTGSNTTTATPPVTTNAAAMMNRLTGSLQFGNEEETLSSSSSAATVSNGGTVSVAFNAPYYAATGSTADFALQSSSTCANSLTLVVGSACTIAAVFTPASTGLYTDTLAFSSTPASTSTLVLTGTGVNLPKTTTTITGIIPASPVYGQTVTITATVSPVTAGTQPAGTVTFFVDTIAQLPATTLNGSAATITLSGLAGGQHTITASYNGSTTYAPSTSATSNVTVGKSSTTTTATIVSSTVYANPTSQVPGVTITFTATVAPSLPGTPTGTVAFYTTGSTTPLGSVPLPTSGTASFSTTTLPIGQYNIVAVYSGDMNYTTSTSTPPLPLLISNPTILLTSASTSVIGNGPSITLNLYSVSGFGIINNTTGAVDLACGNLPAYSACSFTPAVAVVNPTNSAAILFKVIVNQPPVIVVPGSVGSLPLFHGRFSALLAMLFLLPVAFAGLGIRRGNRRKASALARCRTALIAVLLLSGCTALFTGCGGSSTGTFQTPAGTTTIQVNATISTTPPTVNPPVAQTLPLQLMVN